MYSTTDTADDGISGTVQPSDYDVDGITVEFGPECNVYLYSLIGSLSEATTHCISSATLLYCTPNQVSATQWFIEAFSYTDVEEWAIELSLTDGDTNDFTFSSSVSTVSFAVEAERVDAESDLLLSATPFVHVQCARFPMTNVVHTE